MGQRQEWTFLGVSITTEPTQAFTWAGLQASPGPDEGGVIPSTFAKIPAVEITRVYGDGKFYVAEGDETVTGVTITGSGNNDPLPIKIDLKVVSRETVTPVAGAPGTAVKWPFYATVDDVKDKLLSIKKNWSNNGDLTEILIVNHISLTYGEINSAAAIGGYNAPLVNSEVTTLSAGPAASTIPITLGITDITKLEAGDLAFIHGASGTAYFSEYVPVVNVDTVAETAVVLYLRHAYNSGVTIEKCSEAYKIFRQCNAIAGAMAALNATTVGQSIGKNDKVTQFESFLSKCLKALMDGKMSLPGLTQQSGSLISYQTENPNASDVEGGSEWQLNMQS